MSNVYVKNGFQNRAEYLENLADDLGLDFDMVNEMAQLLGPEEDFDGLVTLCEDHADGFM